MAGRADQIAEKIFSSYRDIPTDKYEVGRATRGRRIINPGRCTLRASGCVAYKPIAVFCRTQLTPWPRVSTPLGQGVPFCPSLTTCRAKGRIKASG